MKVKKLTAFFLALLVAVSGFAAMPYLSSELFAAEAVDDSSDGYFYKQLPEESKVFYNAMEKMYEQDIFKTGNGDYDMSKEGDLTQQQIQSYMEGRSNLLSVYGAARDAFYFDHPDIFYVDFSNLSFRVTSGSDGYHLYLGSDRYDNYYTKGFNNKEDVEKAVNEYNTALTNVVNQAKEVTAEENENLTVKKITFVHDYLTKHTSYRLEDVCTPANIGFIRTAYGSLVKHEGVCEAYTRAFKSIMDKLGIPCVMVQGIYRHNEQASELHIWNYVQVDNKWYAVDVTMDDPINSKYDTNGEDGYENQDYLMSGETDMSVHHVASGILSEANYMFQYPVLEIDSYGVERKIYNNGLEYRYNPDGVNSEGEKAGEYWVSFKGMGYREAEKNGYYILWRYYDEDPKTKEWQVSDWYYADPVLTPDNPNFYDTKTELYMNFPQIKYVEYGVTTLAPGRSEYNPDIIDFFYQGDPILLEASTGMLYNPSGTYVAPPYIKKSSPSQTGRLTIGTGAYHVELVYDDTLVPTGTEEDIGLSVDCLQYENGVRVHNESGIRYSKIDNFHWDGDNTITFDFTPSEMWEDDSVLYEFGITGLVGERSKKEPLKAEYVCSHPCAVCAYRSQGYFWNVFGQPTLMENLDVDTQDWETDDGQAIADELKHRMALVVTSPNGPEQKKIDDALAESPVVDQDKLLKTETYNINLTVCKKQVVSTGQGVRISLGFPEGYGPEDEGVTFKAYHFSKDDTGKITSVEEIPCVITKYGLIVYCKSFSPFVIAAVEDDGTEVTTKKTVILSSTDGGKVSGIENISELAEGETKTVKINADNGYVIDSVVYAGKYLNVENNKSMTFEVKYDELSTDSNIIDVKFVSESVAAKEESRQEKPINAAAEPASVSIPQKAVAGNGGELVIESTVSGGDNSYQWYKDETALVGQTGKDLKIDKASASDAGNYKLVVTTFLGATSAIAESEVCRVEVLQEEHTQHTPGEPVHENVVHATCIEGGSYEEVTYCTVCKKVISRVKKTTEPLGHSFGEWQTSVSPDCTNKGSEHRSCTVCDFTETRNINETGHDWDSSFTVDKEATCTEDGSESIHCKKCDAVKQSTVIPKKAHTPGEAVHENVVNATCTESGSYEEVTYCTVCRTEISRKNNTVDALGHSFGEWQVSVSPSCTNKGSEYRRCTVCDFTETKNIDELGHSWNNTYTIDKEATCTEDGSKSVHCQKCDAVKQSTVIPKKEHTPGEAVHENVVEATCTEDGSYTEVVHCTVCHNEISRLPVSVKATGHSFGEWQTSVSPDCTNKGSQHRSCTVCDFTETKNIDETGHDWDTDFTVDKDSTCAEEGSKSIHCKKCDAVKESTVIPKKAHKAGGVSHENSVLPNCTEKGYYDEVTYCADCNAEMGRVTVYVDALGHSFGEWQVSVSPDCTNKGSQHRSCTVCDFTETQNVDETGHDWNSDFTVDKDSTCAEEGSKSIHCKKCDAVKESTIIPTKPHNAGSPVQENNVLPTCTEKGSYDEVVYCTECRNELERKPVSVEALGHSFGEWQTLTSPSCTDKGSEYRTCTVCGFTETQNVDETGHDWDIDFTVDKEATCTEDGSKSIHCKKCDAVKDSTIIPKTGHTSGETVKENVINETCTERGSYDEVVYCTVCKNEISRKTVTVPAKGHSYDEGIVTKEPTETEPGEKLYTCQVCGETYTEEIPVIEPSEPSVEPSETPSDEPSDDQSSEPSVEDSSEPSNNPSSETSDKTPDNSQSGNKGENSDNSTPDTSKSQTVNTTTNTTTTSTIITTSTVVTESVVTTEKGDVSTGDSPMMTIVFVTIAISALGIAFFASKKKRTNQ